MGSQTPISCTIAITNAQPPVQEFETHVIYRHNQYEVSLMTTSPGFTAGESNHFIAQNWLLQRLCRYRNHPELLKEYDSVVCEYFVKDQYYYVPGKEQNQQEMYLRTGLRRLSNQLSSNFSLHVKTLNMPFSARWLLVAKVSTFWWTQGPQFRSCRLRRYRKMFQEVELLSSIMSLFSYTKDAIAVYGVFEASTCFGGSDSFRFARGGSRAYHCWTKHASDSEHYH